jgi:RHS repeat-associated protein
VVSQFFGRGEVQGGVSGTKYLYTFDQLGSVRELLNSSGAVVTRYSYDPYGQVTQTGSVAANFQYAGYYFHAPSGLGLTRTRAYNSNLGRFINRDPIREKGGLNLYGYVGNNPISRKDPSGLRSRIDGDPYGHAEGDVADPPGDDGGGCQSGSVLAGFSVGGSAALTAAILPKKKKFFPPIFGDCEKGDGECCLSRKDDCQSRCNQFYVDTDEEKRYTNCKNCCAGVAVDCAAGEMKGEIFSGQTWTTRCFQKPPNR